MPYQRVTSFKKAFDLINEIDGIWLQTFYLGKNKPKAFLLTTKAFLSVWQQAAFFQAAAVR